MIVGGEQHEKHPVGDEKLKEKYEAKDDHGNDNNGSLIMRAWTKFTNLFSNK